ncbi:hypothetical protein CH373_12775 [Leptospira perolatii]|uniref:DUF3089 domain-containing protein n=1 Tax=Leptospira perolatii TaxID=2023191 RepID=A0A2M9ZKJ7_9LEPT|nr:DUF3089 domain-containing protein [Leptospira perolatii]PJZ70005.1 hypothetical protein CH360_08910 [Leptospira perolatii]PJZ72587.1 hypothetical protein CH373_12775 [Leptospira perolatii]
MQKNLLKPLLVFFVFFYCSCVWLIRPPKPFTEISQPSAPDYSKMENWAAHPDRQNPAKNVPENSGMAPITGDGKVDIFFIHPTTFFGREWNASLDYENVNNKTDEGTIQKQASVFNQVGRIFAPRYRQATIYSFVEKESGQKALELAYKDVLLSFDHYMQTWNKGRPILIASHSQGTRHALRLLIDRFDGKQLQNKLVAAYLIGGAIPINSLKKIQVCSRADQVGCLISWRSVGENGKIAKLPHDPPEPYICVNPLSWKSDSEPVSETFNSGGVPFSFDRVDPGLCGAKCENGLLRITKPNARGYGGWWDGNYHVADYALFYSNIRTNAVVRVSSYFSENK